MAFADPKNNLAQLGLLPGMMVADFGAGTGAYALPAAQAVLPDGKVYAIEIQKGLLAKLEREASNQHLSNLGFLWGDLETVGGSKLPAAQMDLVIMSNLLFQLTGAYPVVLEAKRVLKPGGRVAVIDWTGSHGGLGPHPDKVLSSEAVQKIFTEAGFEFKRAFSAGDQHYGLMFKLPAVWKISVFSKLFYCRFLPSPFLSGC